MHVIFIRRHGLPQPLSFSSPPHLHHHSSLPVIYVPSWLILLLALGLVGFLE